MDVETEAGVYIEKGNIQKSYRIPGECSVSQAEILTIINNAEQSTISLSLQDLSKLMNKHEVIIDRVPGHSRSDTSIKQPN